MTTRINIATMFERKASGECPFCGKKAKKFRDRKSEKEFKISGLCQKCQDKTFGKRS